MKNKYLIWIIVLLWVVVLVGINTWHKRILLTGKTITLKTEPIDPRDPFKGDYVNLLYDISNIQDPLTDEQKTELLRTHKIYAVLKPKDFYFVLDHFTTKRPSLGTTYIQGFVWGEIRELMRISYNIESFYVPEGKGKEVEKHQGKDLFVEVYVDEKGQATIKMLKIGDKPYPFDTP
jgi:uncharacterized membrane-anchored protein